MKNQNIKFAWRQFNELSSNEIYEILHLRQKVFIVEQDCPYIDADFSDQEAWHYLGYEGKKLISYLRVFPPGIKYDDSSIGRIVIDESSRNHGFGKQITLDAIAFLQKYYPNKDICISAQHRLIDFYRRLGFKEEGEVYLEDDIDHIKMRLKVIAKKLSIPLVFNPNKFLILSALLGFLGAFIFAIVDFNFQSIDAPATVNGYPIDTKRFQAYLSAVESSRKFGLRSEDRLNVLNLLINEELLIQRAKDLGLIENDNEIRDVITSRMLNYIIEPLQNNTVDELSLKSFYESNIQMFANPDQYLFEEWIFNSEFERSKLVELLEADNFFKPDFKYKKTTNNWLPRSYVSFEKISDYLGSEKAQLLTEVEENNFILFSDYQRQDFSVYFLIDKISKPPRAFQEIKDIVMIEYKKSQENEVIEDYLNNLRETYIVEISDDF